MERILAMYISVRSRHVGPMGLDHYRSGARSAHAINQRLSAGRI